MAITYTWEVTSLKTQTEGDNVDAVVFALWTKIGTDENGNTGSYAGATPFTSVNTENFIAFADLTEELVLGWIQSVVVDGYEHHVNKQIERQISAAINPITDAPLPWV